MACLIGRQMQRARSLTPPDSELEAELAQRPRSVAGRQPAVGPAAPPASGPAVRPVCGGRARRRSAFTLPSESSTSAGLVATSRSSASAVPPLDLPPSLPSRGPSAAAAAPARRLTKIANISSRLAVLRKASFLRVSIDSVSFEPVFVRSVTSAPDAGDARVYIEYDLPVESSTSSRRTARLGGKKIATETVLCHRSVIPLQLTAAGIRLWQASELQVTALGQSAGRRWTLAVAALPLRQLLRQPRLTLSRRLALTLRAAGRPVVGHVRLRLQLGSDQGDFQAALSAEERHSSRANWPPVVDASEVGGTSDADDQDEVESVEGESSQMEENVEELKSRPATEEGDGKAHAESRLATDGKSEWCQSSVSAPLPSERSSVTADSSKARLVHWALHVGRGTPTRPGALRNTYLVVRAPWLQQAATSVTCWAEEQPQYDYTLVSPVLLTAPLVESLHNNLLVVEMWQRSRVCGQDRLVGLSRLPLERLYLTFSQLDVADTVLHMKSPLLVHEGRLAVSHPATDTAVAHLELTLAAGTQQQVEQWRLPGDQRRQHQSQPAAAVRDCSCTMKIHLGRLLHVPEVNEARSGEMDCFVQYSWPVQTEAGELCLRSFTTEPAISRVNPSLNHRATHQYRATTTSRLAEAFVAACAPDAGCRWDVMVRTFYPAVQDQLIARGVLSSSQIFGMMEACREDGRQSRLFAVPLQLLVGGDDPAHPALEVSLSVDTAPSPPVTQTGLGGSCDSVHPAAGVPAQRPPTSEHVTGLPAADGAARLQDGAAGDGDVRQVAREPALNRRHTWVCERRGQQAWNDRREFSPPTVSRVEGSQSEMESRSAESVGRAEDKGRDEEDDIDSGPTSEAEMLQRLRRPLGSLLSDLPAAETDRAVILTDIERDLERLRRTGSIFSGQRRRSTESDGRQQTVDTAGATESATTAPAEPEKAETEPEQTLPEECGGAGEPAGRRSWAAEREQEPEEALGCGRSFQNIPLVDPAALSGDLHQHVLYARTDPLPSGRRSADTACPPAGSPSGTDTPTTTRAASSVQNPAGSDARDATSSAENVPTRGPLSSESSQAAPLLEPAPVPASRAQSWVRDVSAGARAASSPDCASSVTATDPPLALNGDGGGEGSFRAQLTVVEALHLPRIVRGGQREQPCVLVSVQTAAGLVSTAPETGTRPRWNWSRTISIGRELLRQEFHYLVLKVWHRSGCGRDKALGLVLIDLVPLLHGLDELLGWYNIVDLAGVCRGQMKLSLRPLDDVPCVDHDSLDLSASLDDPDRPSYVTMSCHSSFPSHLIRYPELVIRAVNNAAARRRDETPPRVPVGGPPAGDGDGSNLRPPRTGGGDEAAAVRPPPETGGCELLDGSRSFLTSVLRKNLEDLESLKAGLLCRSEPSCYDGQSGQRLASQVGCTPASRRQLSLHVPGQVGSGSPHNSDRRQEHGQKTSANEDFRPVRSVIDSRTYTSLTNGAGHCELESGAICTADGDKINSSSQRERCAYDVSANSYEREQLYGRLAAEPEAAAEAAERRGPGSGASTVAELPASVVELIETAVRRSAEVPSASSDSDSLPFDDNLRSLNDSGDRADNGSGADSHAELLASILQEMDRRDAADRSEAALAAILARDIGQLVARASAASSSGNVKAPASPGPDRAGAASVVSGRVGEGAAAAGRPAPAAEPPSDRRDEGSGDGRRSARRRRLAAALDMK